MDNECVRWLGGILAAGGAAWLTASLVGTIVALRGGLVQTYTWRDAAGQPLSPEDMLLIGINLMAIGAVSTLLGIRLLMQKRTRR